MQPVDAFESYQTGSAFGNGTGIEWDKVNYRRIMKFLAAVFIVVIIVFTVFFPFPDVDSSLSR